MKGFKTQTNKSSQSPQSGQVLVESLLSIPVFLFLSAGTLLLAGLPLLKSIQIAEAYSLSRAALYGNRSVIDCPSAGYWAGTEPVKSQHECLEENLVKSLLEVGPYALSSFVLQLPLEMN